MEPRDARTRRIILCGVWTGIGLCVVGTALMFFSAGVGFAVLFCGLLVVGILMWIASGSSGPRRPDRERRRPADDGGSSELGFITRGIRGDITPFGQPAKKRDP